MPREIFNSFHNGQTEPLVEIEVPSYVRGVRGFAEIGKQPFAIGSPSHEKMCRMILSWVENKINLLGAGFLKIQKPTFYHEVFGEYMNEEWWNREMCGRIVAMSLKYNPTTTRKKTKQHPSRSYFEFRNSDDLRWAMASQLAWFRP